MQTAHCWPAMSDRPAAVFGLGWAHPTRSAPPIPAVKANRPRLAPVILAPLWIRCRDRLGDELRGLRGHLPTAGREQQIAVHRHLDRSLQPRDVHLLLRNLAL